MELLVVFAGCVVDVGGHCRLDPAAYVADSLALGLVSSLVELEVDHLLAILLLASSCHLGEVAGPSFHVDELWGGSERCACSGCVRSRGVFRSFE